MTLHGVFVLPVGTILFPIVVRVRFPGCANGILVVFLNKVTVGQVRFPLRARLFFRHFYGVFERF